MSTDAQDRRDEILMLVKEYGGNCVAYADAKNACTYPLVKAYQQQAEEILNKITEKMEEDK